MKTKSRIGSTLLINWESQTVVKFSQDPAYDIFVDFAINFKAIYFPIFQSHTVREFAPLSGKASYSTIEMEALVELSEDEGKAIVSWLSEAFSDLQDGRVIQSDPFEIAKGFFELTNLAKKSPGVRLAHAGLLLSSHSG